LKRTNATTNNKRPETIHIAWFAEIMTPIPSSAQLSSAQLSSAQLGYIIKLYQSDYAPEQR
jgi:hypothetical protein